LKKKEEKSKEMKNHQVFFVALLIISGFLFLGGASQAGATCICNESDWDYSAIEIQSSCESMCSNHGGVRTFTAPVRQTCYICCCNNGQSVPGVDCGVSCESAGGVQSSGVVYWCGDTVPAAPACAAVATQSEDPQSGNYNTCTCEGTTFQTTKTCDQACADMAAGGETTYNECTCEGVTFQTSKTCDQACADMAAGGETDTDDTLPIDDEDEDDSGLGIIPGGSGPANVSMPNFSGAGSINELFLKIVRFLMALAIPFAVVMIIWSGFLFATAQGDPTAITKAKKNFIWTIVGVAVILASEAIIGYVSELLGVGGGGGGTAFVERIKTILREIIAVLFILVTVYFFWGIVTYVRAAGDEGAIEKGKTHMIWGIIGMAVMASAWGIVDIISSMVR